MAAADGSDQHLSPARWGELAEMLLLEIAQTTGQRALVRHYAPDLADDDLHERARALCVIVTVLAS